LRQLLDSNALLWFVWGDRKRISPALRARIEADDAEILVSVASIWEIAIKKALGKLEAPDDLPVRIQELGFQLLAIEVEHAWAVRGLPHHHGDPFDRLLIAQAQVERVPVLTADPSFRDYELTVVWE
jgi:PIN domain nuclease of toxin-antitoxin system